VENDASGNAIKLYQSSRCGELATYREQDRSSAELVAATGQHGSCEQITPAKACFLAAQKPGISYCTQGAPERRQVISRHVHKN
jgi:hypothetical protein